MKQTYIFIATFLMAFYVFYRLETRAVKAPPLIDESPIVIPPQPEKSEIELLVDRMNDRNVQIYSILSDKMDVFLIDKYGNYKLNANIAYEKDLKFRMRMRSFLGNESDIGSNNEIFWFWSKRHKPPALHWARHTDIYNTRLKTPFHPKWVTEALCIDKIEIKGGATKTEDHWVLTEKRISPSREIVTKMTLINPKTELIESQFLLDKDGKIEASTEIQEYQTLPGGEVVPKKILIRWHKEKVNMLWVLKDTKVNTEIDKSRWTKPQMRNEIDMGRN